MASLNVSVNQLKDIELLKFLDSNDKISKDVFVLSRLKMIIECW